MVRANPMWLKAPLLLFRWPPILAALGASVIVLVVATAVSPLFISSAAGGALRDGLRGLPPTSAGFVIANQTPLYGFDFTTDAGDRVNVDPAELQRSRERELEARLGNLDHLGPARPTIATAESLLAAGNRSMQVQPLARDGFDEHIDVVDSAPGPGVWIAERAAERLDLTPGERAQLEIEGRTTVRIKGIYRDLETQPVTEFWGPVDRYIYAPDPEAPTPPPLLLVDIPTMFSIGRATHSSGIHSWEYPLQPEGMTLADGHLLARRLHAVSVDALDQTTSLGEVFEEPYSSTALGSVADGAEETVAGIRSPVQVLALVGAIVAAVLIAVAAYYVVQKRSIEFRLLLARGVSGVWLAMRAVVETIVPVTIFAALGAAATVVLVATFGPGPVDAAAIRSAAALSIAAIVIAVAAFGYATTVAANRKTAVEHAAAGHDAGFPWEVILLALAGVTLYFIDRRGAIRTTEHGGSVDLLLVVWPIVSVAGASLLVLRGAFSYLNGIRSATERSRTALFLAARRLAGSSRSVRLFVGAAAVSVGVLVYSTALVSSVRATTHAKTHVFVGSDVAVIVSTPDDVPDIAVPHTIAASLDADIGEREVDVMAVDPKTFEGAAYWDEEFADRSLGSLLADLTTAEGGSMPVVVAGDSALEPPSLAVAGHDVPIEIVGRAETWPGMRQGRPIFVTTLEELERAATETGFSAASAEQTLWARGDTNRVLDEMQRAGIDTQSSVTARDAGRSSALLSISWTFGLLRVLGIVSGLLAVVGMLLYVASRQRARLVSYLLGRRMGLTGEEHRLSVLVEIGVMFLAALVLGSTLGLAAALLVYGGLDLLRTVPPAPLFRVPTPEVIAAALAFLVSAVAGAAWIQRASDRARPGEVMRLAD